MSLERIVKFDPAYDKRNEDPEKDYGVGNVTMTMLIRGDRGAVQFKVFTGWGLPEVDKEMWAKSDLETLRLITRPMASDLGYHSPVPRYKDQTLMDDACEYTSTGVCYYDGSTINAEPVWDLLLRAGSDAVWERLQEYYRSIFLAEGEIVDPLSEKPDPEPKKPAPRRSVRRDVL